MPALIEEELHYWRFCAGCLAAASMSGVNRQELRMNYRMNLGLAKSDARFLGSFLMFELRIGMIPLLEVGKLGIEQTRNERKDRANIHTVKIKEYVGSSEAAVRIRG